MTNIIKKGTTESKNRLFDHQSANIVGLVMDRNAYSIDTTSEGRNINDVVSH